MGDSVFMLYYDVSEVEEETDDPAYLRGIFTTSDLARNALVQIGEDPTNPCWVIVEEAVDQAGWREGFATMRSDGA